MSEKRGREINVTVRETCGIAKREPVRKTNISSGLRLSTSAQGAGLSIAGRIESGHMQLGDSVLVQPANEVATIRGELMGL